MKKYIKLALFIALAFAAMTESRLTLARNSEPLQKRFLLKLKTPVPRDVAERTIEARGLTVQRFLSEIEVYVADSKDPSGLKAVEVESLRRAPEFLYFEPNAVWSAIAVPNDPQYAEQIETRRLDIESAWDVTTGSNSVLVAVSDTGASLDHPDLVNRIDPNGFNFVSNNSNPMDDNGHGTHVSGILGAEGNNGIGIAGMNWNIQILPVKFLGANGTGSTEHGVDTILYATNHGARIINASWSGSVNSNALRDAINFAFDHGTLLIAAAGNSASNTDQKPEYPADYRVPGVVAVASSQSQGLLSGFSNFGERTVAFAAPGSDILSTLLNRQYGRLSGTSMAAPMATGVAALMLSIAPQLTALELKNALINAVDERPSYAGKLATSGDLNAGLAVQQLSAGFQVWPGRVSLGVGESFQLSAYQAVGAVTWASSDPSVATINAHGSLQGVKSGLVQASATDSRGQQASTQWVHVVASIPAPGGGGGCARARQIHDRESPMADASAAASIGLPLLAGYLVSRRKRRREASWPRG